ncbi:MAG: ATP-binding protein [Pseudomonadota bacterium]
MSKLSSLIDRMTTVTQQLRVFARSRNNETQRIDLKKAIEETLVAMQPILAGSNVESFIETPPEPVWVMAGRVRIEQVLVNLLKNAIDAMQETGEQSQKHVYIKLRPTDNHRVELSVADTGPGIKEEVINSLFEPFESTKPSGQGMGLGLAISNSIIAEIKGEMRAENRAEGGALFTILIDGAD